MCCPDSNGRRLFPAVTQRIFSVCVVTIALALCACSAPAQELPKDTATQIRSAWALTRKDFKYDARFLYLGFERENATEGFQTEYLFGADSAPLQVYRIMRGPKGSSQGLRPPVTQPVLGKLLPEEPVIRMLTSQVIEPSQAVEIARKHGMKGNVLRVILQAWGGPPLEVWRIVPDNDPAADPNDPIMKNYIVDAMTGAFYSDSYFTGTHVDAAEYNRNLGAYTQAILTEFIQGLRKNAGR
jgi:hypothetical protein